MELEYVNAESLREHPENPKRHTPEQIEHLRNSIFLFGWTQPIVVDESNQILVGHGRWKAASSGSKVPILRLKNLKEHQKKMLMLIDNATNAETGFDASRVEEIMAQLSAEQFPAEDLGLAVRVLGESGERAVDENKLQQSMKRYLDGETKRLVLYMTPAEAKKVEDRIDELMRGQEIPMRCDLVMAMILEYEREHGKL